MARRPNSGAIWPGKANGGHASQTIVPVLEVAPGDPVSLRERRLSWAELLMRVCNEDVLECRQCGGRVEVISAITQTKVIQASSHDSGTRSGSHPLPVRGQAISSSEEPGRAGPRDNVVSPASGLRQRGQGLFRQKGRLSRLPATSDLARAGQSRW